MRTRNALGSALFLEVSNCRLLVELVVPVSLLANSSMPPLKPAGQLAVSLHAHAQFLTLSFQLLGFMAHRTAAAGGSLRRSCGSLLSALCSLLRLWLAAATETCCCSRVLPCCEAVSAGCLCVRGCGLLLAIIGGEGQFVQPWVAPTALRVTLSGASDLHPSAGRKAS